MVVIFKGIKPKKKKVHQCKIWTGRIGAPEVNCQDVSVKSGSIIFAPTWDMVMQYLKGEMSEKVYTRKYRAMMKISRLKYSSTWERVLEQDKVIFTCFCQAGDFCHRVLLAKMFEEMGAKYCGELYRGKE